MRGLTRGIPPVCVALLAGLTLSACGGSSKHVATTTAAALAPPGAVVAQVGTTTITGATYDHWMAVGAATVTMPPAHGPLPRPVAYEPPDFTACVSHLRAGEPKATTAQLQAKCKKAFEGIRARILDFLITASWLQGEAAEQHISVTEAEVRKKFEEEKRAHYPTAAAFHRLQEASLQTVPDLMLAVQRSMLSERLLARFTKLHGKGRAEQANIAAFNKYIRDKWTARTDCRPGYLIKDCRQHR